MCGTKCVTKSLSMLRSEQVSDAIKSGVNQKIADGHNLYLVVKNGKGFWVYQFRDGNVIRSKGLGSAAAGADARGRARRRASEPDNNRASRRHVAPDMERSRQQSGKPISPVH